jgi:hypothetical protein
MYEDMVPTYPVQSTLLKVVLVRLYCIVLKGPEHCGEEQFDDSKYRSIRVHPQEQHELLIEAR